MNDEKKLRFFIRNPDGETCWAYCGELSDRAALVRAFGDFMLCEVEEGLSSSEGRATYALEVKAQEMTDAEVAALPEM
jgi:hypothetical protein